MEKGARAAWVFPGAGFPQPKAVEGTPAAQAASLDSESSFRTQKPSGGTLKNKWCALQNS